ncbi:MAG: hypothetical protein ACOX6P_06035 [Candidatus Merdivicinus sp.]|jgi:hypothetical protein
MFTKKTNFKAMKADAILSAYKKNILIFWVLHALTVVGAVIVAVMFFTGKSTITSSFFSVVFLCVLNYLFYTGRKLQFHMLNQVLNNNCDPIKFEKIFRGLEHSGMNKVDCQLNIARGQFYAGKPQEALDTLLAMPRPKEGTLQIFQYYNVMAGCYEATQDFERVVEVREKVKKLMIGLKEGTPALRNGQQLLTIIDGILTFHQGSYMRCYEIYEDLFDASSYPLSRMTVLIKLAKMDQMTGAARSAIDHCEYILDAGGTTFYKKQAQEILELCRPRKKEETESPEEDSNGTE